jgi:hypothetical protein
MTTQQTLNLEALKLLKDWGVWMVTVQTAVIAFLGTGREPPSEAGYQACDLFH